MKKKLPTSQNGFVILFVVLIAAIVLLIGAGVFTISLKQNILSSTARESQMAFSAADSAVECALYYDRLGSIVPGASINCASKNITVASTAPSVYEFPVVMSGVYGIAGDALPCALVEIDKNFIENTVSYTRILARGYNVCDSNGDPIIGNPLLLERVLEVKYTNTVVTSGTSSGGNPGASTGGSATSPGGSVPGIPNTNPGAGTSPSAGQGQ